MGDFVYLVSILKTIVTMIDIVVIVRAREENWIKRRPNTQYKMT